MLIDSLRSVRNRILLIQDRKNEALANRRKFPRLRDGTTRIYHYHVRKTGGTSINHAFLALDDLHTNEVYEAMLRSPTKRYVGDKCVFVGWNKFLLERGNYSFGFSHIPYDHIRVPDGTHTITCLRDPKRRLISHYKMLLRYSEREVMSRGMRRELRWLDSKGGIIGTLRNMPRSHLLNQLYMFSTNLSVNEALENISSLGSVLMTETLGQDIQRLGDHFGVKLEPKHVRQDNREIELGQNVLEFLDELLEPEYQFIHSVDRLRTASNLSLAAAH